MSEETVIVPGLYRILQNDPKDVTKGPGGVIKDIVPPPPLYATAPVDKGNQKEDKNLGPITLNAALDDDRQIWEVKVVNEEDRVYTITRADGVWLPPERAPSFGFDGLVEVRKPISCMGFKKPGPTEPMPPNPFKWRVLYHPPLDSWLQQSMFAIIPVPKLGEELEYFIDDETPALSVRGGYGTEEPQPPEPAMVLNKVEGGIKPHPWYFEPYFRAS